MGFGRCFLVALLWGVLACVALAQTSPPAEQRTILAVDFTGEVPTDGRILPDRVFRLVGEPYSDYVVRKAVERLYETGLFAQVHAYRIDVPGGVRLRFHLEAKTLVESVSFAGNVALKTSALRSVLRLTEGSEFHPSVLAKDVERLQELYARNGYRRATIRPSLEMAGKRVEIRYAIDEGPPAKINLISFEGIEAVSETELRRAVSIEPNAIASERVLERVRRRVRDFYLERQFIAVQVAPPETTYLPKRNRVNVRIRIEEGRRVRVAFEGNEHFDDATLQKVVSIERDNEFALEAARADLEAFYRRHGYFKATVEEPIRTDAPDALVVTFRIHEGRRYTIEEVRFEGNTAFSDEELLDAIQTRPRSRWGWMPLVRRFFSDGLFRPEIFEEDRRILEVLYRQAGYLDVRVSGGPELDENETRLIVRIRIDEGDRSLVEEIVVEGNSAIPTETIRSRLATREGAPLNRENVDADAIRIREMYARNGYPYCDVRPEFDLETGRLVFHIAEGKRATIGRITVVFENPNPKTRPEVILRELLFKEGEPFNAQKLNRSRERVFRLGFIGTVSIETPGVYEGQETLDVRVVVRERNAGSANLSGGFSPSEGVRGTIDVVQRNWHGTGRRIGLKLRLGTLGSRYEARYVEPWLLGTPTRTTFRLFRDNLEEQDDIVAAGGLVNFSRTISQYNRLTLQYRYQIFSVAKGHPEIRLEALGIRRTLGAVGLSFLRDTRNDLFNPTRGWWNELRLEIAGGPLGGATRFTKVTTDTRYFHRLGEEATLATRLRLGISSRRDETSEISSTERFRLGGSTTVRGYPERSLGKPDAFGNYRGNLLFLLNVELRFPVYRIVGGAFFIDVGNIWDDFDEIRWEPPRVAVGGGIRILTPIGPARLDLGFPLSHVRDLPLTPRWWVALGNSF